MRNYEYRATVRWTGNDGTGTSTRTFGRDSEISVHNKPTLIGSAPKEFGGDGQGWAPEDLFVAALSECHMLTYLFLSTRAGIVVESYTDDAVATLTVEGAAGGRITAIELRPVITISAGDPAAAEALHEAASAGCYIGSSVTCEVTVNGTVQLTSSPSGTA